ncbi:molybdopterin-synthase adenylyltransferase MoeB [Vibrio albus]|uniref:Molybdopterin-synthase adenylyltransferase MoeB n=1 Tax=Vibrio albus TaxID=2200953 RepID=A0A2U3B4N0_9VIBR|nr:HesA/MoeB/ThiF family protein [Vibrio albus]PWI31746.1 molybdopterin-synthase adenylyltransferase MoeB [Vibrio albus]
MAEEERLSDQEFLRYQRQISLQDIGEEGQLKLKNASVLIVGCGGLGNVAALYLAAAGVGKLLLADGDVVEDSNLQRQVAYREFDCGTQKAVALLNQINELNAEVDVEINCHYLKGSQFQNVAEDVDLVLDCCDNFATRQEVNRACRELRLPLISGSAIGWKGQLVSFAFHKYLSPCYHCLYPFKHNDTQANCLQGGIVGPVAGMIGTAQALQAITYFTQSKSLSWSVLHVFDALTFEWQALHLMQDDECLVCGSNKENSHLDQGEEVYAHLAQ